MGNVLTSILTDASVRSDASVEGALMQQAESAAPWYNDLTA
jgi:hypothetical protein